MSVALHVEAQLVGDTVWGTGCDEVQGCSGDGVGAPGVQQIPLHTHGRLPLTSKHALCQCGVAVFDHEGCERWQAHWRRAVKDPHGVVVQDECLEDVQVAADVAQKHTMPGIAGSVLCMVGPIERESNHRLTPVKCKSPTPRLPRPKVKKWVKTKLAVLFGDAVEKPVTKFTQVDINHEAELMEALADVAEDEMPDGRAIEGSDDKYEA
ncbi:hypothetical protein B0H10DRAFT_1940373 [Mycena sp. CBHHK59/15]|nr:hypothetical protein B0H10DRAFT_1940373 [Mycena sp. CBHHK59/15]